MTAVMRFGFRVVRVTTLVVGLATPALAQKKIAMVAPYVPPAGAWERRSPSAMGMDSVKLADAIAYVEAALDRGLEIDSFAPRLSFFFNAHIDFFEEIAKYRAARKLWAEAMKNRFGAKNPRSWALRFHTQTAGVSLTAHWTFMFWQQKYLRDLPEVRDLPLAGQNRAAVIGLMVLMAGSILGNYAAAAVARSVGYRKAVVSFCLIYGVTMGLTFLEARTHSTVLIGFFFVFFRYFSFF